MALGSYSSNVIWAKARAMYGRSVTRQQMEHLLHCHSVSEISSFLKNETAYAPALSDVNEATVHRGHLEQLLRRKLWNDYASLTRYDLAVGMRLSDYMIGQEETEQLILCARLMNAGRSDEFVLSIPAFFEQHARLDMVGMGRARSPGELLAALEGTPYYRLLAHLLDGDPAAIPVTDMETALYTHLNSMLLATLSHTRGSVRRQLRDFIGARLDAQNVVRILRLKTYFNASPADISRHLLPGGGTLPPRTVQAILHAPTAQEASDIFFRTRTGRRIPPSSRSLSHHLDMQAAYYIARHHIHFSSSPMVVLLSYILLMDSEVQDITTIIEGVRYKLPPEEIRPMLVQYS